MKLFKQLTEKAVKTVKETVHKTVKTDTKRNIDILEGILTIIGLGIITISAWKSGNNNGYSAPSAPPLSITNIYFNKEK